jgi:hypothetical protein
MPNSPFSIVSARQFVSLEAILTHDLESVLEIRCQIKSRRGQTPEHFSAERRNGYSTVPLLQVPQNNIRAAEK